MLYDRIKLLPALGQGLSVRFCLPEAAKILPISSQYNLYILWNKMYKLLKAAQGDCFKKKYICPGEEFSVFSRVRDGSCEAVFFKKPAKSFWLQKMIQKKINRFLQQPELRSLSKAAQSPACRSEVKAGNAQKHERIYSRFK